MNQRKELKIPSLSVSNSDFPSKKLSKIFYQKQNLKNCLLLESTDNAADIFNMKKYLLKQASRDSTKRII